MNSLEPEIRRLIDEGAISLEGAREPLAIEHRAVFSVQGELRAVLYAGVTAVATGVGLVVKDHLDRIGPVAITLAVALLAIASYLPALLAWQRGTQRRLVGDYLLLLGALLASADLGYAEHAFRLLGSAWPQHLLLLALFHAATAYLLRSRLVLSVALTAFVGWVGAEVTFSPFFPLARATVADAGFRFLVAAIALVGFRALHVRLARGRPDFTDIFEGFAVHLAGVGALMRLLPGYIDRQVSDAALWSNVALLALVVGIMGAIGWKRRQEHFVLAAIAYAVIGFWRLQFRLFDDALLLSCTSLLTLIAAAAVMWRVRAGFRDRI